MTDQIVSKKLNNHQKKPSWIEQARSLIGIILLAFFIRTFFYGLYQVPTPSMEVTMLVGERFLADKLTICFSDPKRGEIVTLNQPTYKYSENKLVNIWQRYVGVSIGLNGIDLGPSNWTKRVIGEPGDELKGVLEGGRPVIYLKKSGEQDFAKLEESYLNKYPIIATFKADRHDSVSYRSWDPSKPLDQQPFYQFTKSEIELAKMKVRDYYIDDKPVKNPQTPYISIANKAQQPWLTGEADEYGRIALDEFQVKLGQDQYWLMGDNRLGSHDSRAWGPVNKQLMHGKIKFRIWSLDSDGSWWILDLLMHPIDFWKKVRWSRCFQTVK